MVGDAAKFFGLSIILALCVLTANAGPCFSRTDGPAPVLVLAAAPGRHVVKAGDTINVLAQRYGVPAQAILKANPGLDPSRLQLGREIVIPATGRPAPVEPAPAQAAAKPSQGVELRPGKAPQATPPPAGGAAEPIVSHDLPDAGKNAAGIPAPSFEKDVVPARETPVETLPAREQPRGGSAEKPPAIAGEAPPLVAASPIAVEKVGDRTRIAIGGADIFADQIVPWALSLGSRLLSATVMFAVGLWVSNRVAGLLARILNSRGVPPEVVSFARSLCRYGLSLVVLIASLGQLGLNVSSLLALFGAAGLAVSLALKDTLSNFASGVMLLLFRLFMVGDRVSVPGVPGAAGFVEDIDIFNTVIRSDAGERIIIPNSKIAGNIIVVGREDGPGNK